MATLLSWGISIGSVIIFRLALSVIQFPGLGRLLEDVIVGDSPSAVVHVTRPCGGCTFFLCKSHHGRLDPTTAVAPFMINSISWSVWFICSVFSKLPLLVHSTAHFTSAAFVKKEKNNNMYLKPWWQLCYSSPLFSLYVERLLTLAHRWTSFTWSWI